MEFNFENEHVLKTVHRIEDGTKNHETVEWFNVQRVNDQNGEYGPPGAHVTVLAVWDSNSGMISDELYESYNMTHIPFVLRYIACEFGACEQEDPATYPSQRIPCYESQWCNGWSNWGSWSTCSAECGGGTKERRRPCDGATPGLQGCQGSQFDKIKCNTFACRAGQNRYADHNEYGMPQTKGLGSAQQLVMSHDL